MIELVKAGTSDALVINGISKRSIGGAILFLDGEKLNIGRIFISPEHHRKGYGIYIMQEIEGMFPAVKEFYPDTPIWNIRTNSLYQKLGYTEYKRDSEFVYYMKVLS